MHACTAPRLPRSRMPGFTHPSPRAAVHPALSACIRTALKNEKENTRRSTKYWSIVWESSLS
eukprot:6196788-Pleurochrysis_carterae.AAC.5